ncbi:MAG: tRNA 4-thiouridine(8) synthase ThiI [Clostridia bacterium]|nr:tRNA 4-thiouridine(8) synthase ThiI [Clostridia bacterium]
MKQVILVKYGEIILKGLNRPIFEDLLVKNIRAALRGMSPEITKAQATTYISLPDEENISEATERLKKVFGIVSITRAYVLPKEIGAICEGTAECLKDELSAATTFKVEAKRSDKKFPLKSPEICREVGGALCMKFPHLAVDVKAPEKIVMVEVRDTNTYVYCDKIKGPGGMPVGTNAKAMLLLSGGIDSPVAGYMAAKRGVALEAVHFFSHPYTSDRAKEKVLELAKIVSGYTGGMRVHVVPFTDIQLEIRKHCPEEQLTIIMRRFMMKISERIARKNGAIALVTGESIGQVASQTVEALGVTNDAVSLPVFRPVIGMDKDEIVERARMIGTFETSILPYEDCCTIFTPKHPNTKPKLDKIKASEELLDCETLINAAVDGVETIFVS